VAKNRVGEFVKVKIPEQGRWVLVLVRVLRGKSSVGMARHNDGRKIGVFEG